MSEYPTKKQLKKIRKWNPSDLHGLMAYVKDIWQYADSGYWRQDGEVYSISTAGWSGNEEIIIAMKSNHVWWMMFWQGSKRGGHYTFCRIGTNLL